MFPIFKSKSVRNRCHPLLIAGCLLIVLEFAPNAKAISTDDQAARDAAVQWLNLLDAHQYNQAWDAQPPRIRAGIRENFIRFMQSRRAPLGRARSRSFLKVTRTNKLIGAPDGNYEKIGFKTSFERKADSVEGVIVTKETGHWQVSGYKIF